MKQTSFAILLATFALAIGFTRADAQVLNGTFGANISSFIYYPGYSGAANYTFNPTVTGLSNAPIQSWASTDDTRTGLNSLSLSYGAPFEPTGYGANDPAQFAFIQNANSLTQLVSLVAGGTYTLSFDSAPRTGSVTTADVTLISGGLTYETAAANVVAGTDLTELSYTFIVPLTVTGTSTLSLNNLNPTGGDNTEDFAGITLTRVIIPEPSEYALIGLGLALLVIARRAGSSQRA